MADERGSTHAKRAAYELRQRILGGDLPGGTRLYEVALAEELNISRTPVREAMSRLAEEGLLERGQGGGFQVRSFTLADVLDAIELRGVLEGTAARLAAERGVDAGQLKALHETLTGLDACFGAVGAPVDFDRYSELNQELHTRLAEFCGSRLLLRELERVKSLPFASPSAFVLGQTADIASHASLVIGQAQHRALIGAIEGREGGRAEFIAREHARIARANLEWAYGVSSDGDEAVPGMALIVG